MKKNCPSPTLVREACSEGSSSVERLKRDIEVSPDCWRCIHLKENPLEKKREDLLSTVKSLREENKKLTARLQLLEAGQKGDITMKVDEAVRTADEVEELRQRLSAEQKEKQQLMKCFKATSKEFREIVYKLTGFRVDALKQKEYKFSHIYAENKSDVLLFKLEADGTMTLLENDYSKRLTRSIETYLKKRDSFPAFLASLTLDLFQKRAVIMSPDSS